MTKESIRKQRYTTVSLEKIVKKQMDDRLPRGISYNRFFKHLLERYRDYPNIFLVQKSEKIETIKN